MATTATWRRCPEFEREQLAQLDDAIDRYADGTDEASIFQARRLRRIRHGIVWGTQEPTTIACPSRPE